MMSVFVSYNPYNLTREMMAMMGMVSIGINTTIALRPIHVYAF